MASGIIGRAVMFEYAVCDVLLEKFGKCVELLVLVKFILAGFDLSFDVECPIFCLFFALEMVADNRVALDADD